MVWVLSAALIAGFAANVFIAALFPTASLGIFWIERSRRREYALALLLTAAVFCYGTLSSWHFKQDLELAARTTAANHGRLTTLYGWVCGFPEQRRGGVRFPFQTTIANRPVRLLVTGVAFDLAYGDSVALSGTFVRIREDRRRYLTSRGAAGTYRASAGGIHLLRRRAAGSTVSYYAGRLHESIRRRLTRGLGARCGIPLALLIGERGMVSRKLKTTFSQLGISHLLALSGMHLGLIVGGVLAVLRFLRVRSRSLLFLVLTLYVGAVGEVVSLHRAYVMAALLILASHLGRPLQPMSALGSALFVLLVFSPELVYSVAFQLSFAATFAVLLCLTRFRLKLTGSWRRRIAGGVLATLVVSTCVQLFLAPVQLHYFRGVSVCAPVATLLFFPAVAAVLFGSALAVAASATVPPAAPTLFGLLDLLTRCFEQSLLWLSAFAPGLSALPKPNPVLYYGGLGICWLAGKQPWRVAAGVVICLSAFVPL